jgi:hypothetical protein
LIRFSIWLALTMQRELGSIGNADAVAQQTT